jgi:hypothetical protein
MSDVYLIALLVFLILLPIAVYCIQVGNMNYYKTHGREPIEIKYWLKSQPWRNAFITNIKNEIIESHRDDNGNVLLDKELMKEIEDKTDEILNGCLDTKTISDAFTWMNSLEGSAYWGDKEYKFLRWYFVQYVDFHLLK